MNRRNINYQKDEFYRKFLQKNNFYIVTHLDVVKYNSILSYLYKKEVLSEPNIERINSFNTNIESGTYLMNLLEKRNPETLEHFFDALGESGQSYIKDALQSCWNATDSNEKYMEPITESVDVTDCVRDFSQTGVRIIMIINNNKFIKETLTRKGSSKDSEDLISFFVNKLCYEPYKSPFINLTATQMLKEIKAFSAYIEKFEKCFAILVIMSHGKADHIYGSDEQPLNIHGILSCFDSGNENISKAFIFSCCRGSIDSLSGGGTTSIPASSNDAYSVAEAIAADRIKDKSSWKVAPPQSIILYSTQKDFVSYREDEGTIYIQALLSVLKTHYKTHNFREIVMMVKDEMKRMFPKYAQLPDVKENCFGNMKL